MLLTADNMIEGKLALLIFDYFTLFVKIFKAINYL